MGILIYSTGQGLKLDLWQKTSLTCKFYISAYVFFFNFSKFVFLEIEPSGGRPEPFFCGNTKESLITSVIICTGFIA